MPIVSLCATSSWNRDGVDILLQQNNTEKRNDERRSSLQMDLLQIIS